MKKIISIFLVFLLLSSHLSLAIGTHYCGGMAVKSEVMLGHKHLSCGMVGMDENRKSLEGVAQITKPPCCENEYSSIAINDPFKTPSPISKTLNFKFLVSFAIVFINPLSLKELAFNKSTYYPPPLPARDIQILFQSFLI